MATSQKKQGKDKAEEQVTPNSLRSKAERLVLERHRDEYYTEAERLFGEAGLEFKRRPSPQERQARLEAEREARAQAKLDKLLAENPKLAERLQSAAPTVGTGSLELTGDLSNTGAVGA